jgi:hypothetical protein
MKEPPLRLLLGSDAVKFVESADIKKLEADKVADRRHARRGTDPRPPVHMNQTELTRITSSSILIVKAWR